MQKSRGSETPSITIYSDIRAVSKGYALRIKNDAPELSQPSFFREILTENIWVETTLSTEWTVAFRLFAQDGQPVIGEIRIFPSEADDNNSVVPKRPIGEWSALVLGVQANVPPGGIRARLLHDNLRLGEAEKGFDKVLEWCRRQSMFSSFERLGFSEIRKELPAKKRGRKGRPDLFYARIARDYQRSLDSGSRSPIEDVAKRRKGLTTAKVRAMIHQARLRGLLGTHVQGKAGGRLTDRAQQILAQAKTNKRRGDNENRPTKRQR